MLAFMQLGLAAFLTLYLVTHASMTAVAAGAVFAGVQLAGGASRIGLGALSDRIQRRLPLLQVVAAAVILLVCAAILVGHSNAGSVALAVALVVGTSWNGVAVAAAVARARDERTGAALGMQTTANAAAGALAPIVLGAVLGGWGWTSMLALVAAAGLVSLACSTWLVATSR
jgi:nitrate/nitrite transporter NarK